MKRSFSFKAIFSLLVILLLAGKALKAQHELDVIRLKDGNNWRHFSDAPNALYHYLEEQAYDLLDKRTNAIARLQSRSAWQERQEWIRETLMDIVGPFPEKTPLNAKITGTIDREYYRVEHIIYESQPGFYVTSSLFIPDRLQAEAPAIIYCSGHASEGYRHIPYQHVILNLVKKGFIVFAFDPASQGERLQYYDPETGKSALGGETSQHFYSGAQAFITGSSQARIMIWDGIRAVDYLLTRKEVDPARIGITGRSGGGTQSAYIAAFDDRIYAAAPECYITNFKRLLQSRGPQDAEQNFRHGILRGIDHADLLAVRAPKPALIIATTRDIFNIHGTRNTAKEVSRIYKAYGRDDHFKIVEDDAEHESTQKNREAMYAFFRKHLGNPGNAEDQETVPLSGEEIQVTRTGQVATSLGGETVFSLNRREAEKRTGELQLSRDDLAGHLSKVVSSAKRLSGYLEPAADQEPVLTGRIQRAGYVIERYFVEGEDYIIPYLLMIPDQPNDKGLIYLHHLGKSAEASAGAEMEWFAREGFTVLAPDLIGIGEAGPPRFKADLFVDSYRVWLAAVLTGRSIVGVQARDVVTLTRLLGEYVGVSEVYGLARKEMAPVLLHAAAFDQAISRIALIEPYSSYRSIATEQFYDPHFVQSIVPGALDAYDLPDLAASLAPRKLLMAGMTDGAGNAAGLANIREDLSVIRTAYQARNANGQLSITPGDSAEKLHDLFREWIAPSYREP